MVARIKEALPESIRVESAAARGGRFVSGVVAKVPFAVPVDVSAPGHEFTYAWSGVAGATGVAVRSAQLTLSHFADVETVESLPVSGDVITIPAGKRVKALKLELTVKDAAGKDVPVTSASTSQRLVVTVSPDGGPFPAPSFAVPEIPANGLFPATMTGATFSGGVLTLPNVLAQKLRISLVKSGFPSSHDPIAFTLVKAGGQLVTWPRNLTLTDDAGTVQWALPGEMQPRDVIAIDLRNAAEISLKTKVGTAPLAGSFTLQGTGTVNAAFEEPAGSVVRTFSGVVSTGLEGDPVPLALEPPAIARPSRARADLTVTYRGLRILDNVSSAVPPQAGGVAGVVVGEKPVLHVFPPLAFDGLRIARIGIIGRAPVDCELVAELLDASSGAPGAALTTRAAAMLAAGGVVKTMWLDVPQHEPLSVPVILSVRTNHGRFLWAAAPETLVRVAVPDPDPAGRPVRLAGRRVLDVAATSEMHAPGSTIDPAVFAAAPIADSSLFVTFDISDLRLEYDR